MQLRDHGAFVSPHFGHFHAWRTGAGGTVLVSSVAGGAALALDAAVDRTGLGADPTAGPDGRAGGGVPVGPV